MDKTQNGVSGFGLGIDEAGEHITFFIFDPTTVQINAANGTLPNDGRDHLVSVTVDRTAHLIRWYVDGTEDANSPADSSTVTGALANTANFGLLGDSGEANLYAGAIHEVRIWDDVRTGAEITANKDVAISPSAPNLIAYWPCVGVEGIAPTILHDLSPSGVRLTVVNNSGKLKYTSRPDRDAIGDGTETWEFSDNPGMCIADYQTRIMKVPYWRIDWPSYIQTAQDCDELVTIPVASTEKRFTCNGVLSMGEPHKDNLDKLLSSCAGFLSYTGGLWRVRASVWEAPTITVTEDDLAGNLEVRGSSPEKERVNLIRGFYIDPLRQYEPVEFPHVDSAIYLARDNGKVLPFDLELPATNTSTMAQRVAFRLLEQKNNQIIANAPMKALGAKIAPGDTVTLDFPSLGWTAGENKLEASQDIGNDDFWADNGTPIVLSNVAAAPDGTVSADSIEDNEAAAFSGRTNSITIPVGTESYNISVHIKKTGSSDKTIAGIDSGISGGTLIERDIRVDTETGVTDGVAGALTEDLGDYWRISWQLPNNGSASNTTLTLILFPAVRATIGGADDNTQVGTAVFWGVQIDENDFVRPYIATLDVPITQTTQTVRCIEWQRTGLGLYQLTFRNDEAADYADPAESEYSTTVDGTLIPTPSIVPPPTDLVAATIVDGALLSWTDPPSRLYNYIEIWCGDTDNVFAATLIATVPRSPYRDVVTGGINIRYYWIRAVRTSSDASTFEPPTSTTTALIFPQVGQQLIVSDPFIRLGASYWDVSDMEASYVLGVDSDGTDVIAHLTPTSVVSRFFTAQRRGPLEFDGLAAHNAAIEVRYRMKVSIQKAGPWAHAPQPMIRVTDLDGVSNVKDYTTNSYWIPTEATAEDVWFDVTTTIEVNDEFNETPPRYMQVGFELEAHAAAAERPTFQIGFLDASYAPAIFNPNAAVGESGASIGLLPDSGNTISNRFLDDSGIWTDQLTNLKHSDVVISSVTGVLTLDLTLGHSFYTELHEDVNNVVITGWGASGLHTVFLEIKQDTVPRSWNSPSNWLYAQPPYDVSTGAGCRDQLRLDSRDVGASVLVRYWADFTVDDRHFPVPAVGTLALTGYAPSLGFKDEVLPSQAQLTLTGYAPTVAIQIIRSPATATLALAGRQPSIDEVPGLAVSPNGSAVSKDVPFPTCWAGVQFNSNGVEYENASGSSISFTTSRGNWLDSGSSGDVWIQRTINSSSDGLNWKDSGAGRLNLGTTREFGVLEPTFSDNATANVTFDFWDAASGGSKIGSVTYNISASAGL
jgi:hypothetical protein